jgi:hypothetical protein
MTGTAPRSRESTGNLPLKISMVFCRTAHARSGVPETFLDKESDSDYLVQPDTVAPPRWADPKGLNFRVFCQGSCGQDSREIHRVSKYFCDLIRLCVERGKPARAGMCQLFNCRAAASRHLHTERKTCCSHKVTSYRTFKSVSMIF